ncbi:DNA-directed RNA polymerase subunit beta [Ktedonospora formicarum]|uniref:DNA-directed RNA polymerase subunit beta n=1 Tax=Ktedonospora formicarum TaxID=2778364 RepID=A0A8J3MX37_9CHLR|nr:DNA-directed RNA polymerase subunit beta [Ktedonospora formicarum]GHO51025.1 DNA-directed RNA polymerase subunit beta [Ktedonospora formicarum]
MESSSGSLHHFSERVERVSFARIPDIQPMPGLIQIQRDSFTWFKNEGLHELFAEISPIEDFTGKNLSLEFVVPSQPFGPPKQSEKVCRERDATYSAPLTMKARLTNKNSGEIIEKEVFMGDFPLMTEHGTFIINGSERVVVSQLVRSPGAYFTAEEDTITSKRLSGAKLIPQRGAWLEFETSSKNLLSVKVDRKRKLPVTTLLRALGALASEDNHYEEFDLSTDEGLLATFATVDNDPVVRFMQATLERDPLKTANEALLELYKKLRPGDPATLDNARSLVKNLFFNGRRYDLGKVGRYKLNRKFDLSIPQTKQTLTIDDLVYIVRQLIELNNGRGRPDDIDHLGNRRIRCVGELLQAQMRVGLLRMERVIKERMSVIEPEQATPGALINIRPVVAAMREFFGGSQLSQFMEQTNALSEVGLKRRLSALGPGGLSRDRAGIEVRDVHQSHYGRICPIETPDGANVGLVSYLAIYGHINEYGFIETPYRKVYHQLAANDPRLIGRELRSEIPQLIAAGHKQEHVAPTRVDETLFRTLSQEMGTTQLRIRPFVSDDVIYFTADAEERFKIAQFNVRLTANNEFIDERVAARYQNEFIEERVEQIDYVDVSAHQIVGIASSLIPFLEHDDITRAQGGANMQRQAVPLLSPKAPICGTGMERAVAIDSGQVILSQSNGEVTSVTARKIEIIDEQGELHSYPLRKFARTNAGTCFNQRPIVRKGMPIYKGQVIADSTSTENGELALGQNVLVAFMLWEGGNFEDSILISERLVRDDLYTSIHIEEYEVQVRDTKLGPEEITRDLPNAGAETLRNLDAYGMIYVGAQVGPQDILVGKITPKGETELTAEEKLLRAIFGEKAREVKDSSLRMPHGEHGRVIDVKIISREAGDELPAGVKMSVRVSVALKHRIGVGDKMAGRHGNKGVISRVLPVEDMPFLPDGTPVDIILTPLGVPSRMNLGQILETHLGMAAHTLGMKVATPVFDGATEADIQEMFQRAGLPQSGKIQLFDGRTGEPFDHPVTVGYAYMLKLKHLVEEKVHARSTGPYSMITQQPLGGRAQFGGQRFGEMEVWALEGYGAANILQEILTVKSDDIVGRVKTYEAIVKGEEIVEPGVPESFKVLVKELQSLGINVEILNEDEQRIQVIEDASLDMLPELGINLSGVEHDG